MNFIASPFIDDLINLALREDLAYGDLTTSLLFTGEERARGVILAKEPLTVCGLPVAERVLEVAKAAVDFKVLCPEGSQAEQGTIIAELSGCLTHLLSLERTMLNFLQRLSGIASQAKKVASEVAGFTILDTRKTTPGWRVLEKYAVATGGGTNHRMGLADMIMIKNNHLDFLGIDSPQKAKELFSNLRRKKPWHTPIECEVRSLRELELMLEGEPEFLLLDNMSNEDVARCLKAISEADYNPCVEVSGQVTPARIKALKGLGVKYASLGRLTTQIQSVDISMRLNPSSSRKRQLPVDRG